MTGVAPAGDELLHGLVRLVERAEALLHGRARVVLGITGAPGAGKTRLALDLIAALRARHGDDVAAHLPMDGFHLADAQLRRLGRLDRKGAPDTFDVDGYAATLARARRATRDVYVPGFERNLEQPIAAALVVPAASAYVVSEGNYLLTDGWEDCRGHCDEVWFVAVDDGLRRRRLEARHTRFGKAPAAARAWVQSVDQPNADLVLRTAGRADLVVVNGPSGWSIRG